MKYGLILLTIIFSVGSFAAKGPCMKEAKAAAEAFATKVSQPGSKIQTRANVEYVKEVHSETWGSLGEYTAVLTLLPSTGVFFKVLIEQTELPDSDPLCAVRGVIQLSEE